MHRLMYFICVALPPTLGINPFIWYSSGSILKVRVNGRMQRFNRTNTLRCLSLVHKTHPCIKVKYRSKHTSDFIKSFTSLTSISTFQIGLGHIRLHHLPLPGDSFAFFFFFLLTVRFSLGLCIKAPVTTRQPSRALSRRSRPARQHLLNIIECVYAWWDRQIKAFLHCSSFNMVMRKNSMKIVPDCFY